MSLVMGEHLNPGVLNVLERLWFSELDFFVDGIKMSPFAHLHPAPAPAQASGHGGLGGSVV